MKKNKTFWGLALIAIAVLALLDNFGVIAPLTEAVGEISIFSAIIGILFFMLAVSRLLHGKYHEIFIPLAVTFAMFEKNIAFLLGKEDPNLIRNGVLYLIALLLSVGVALLTGGRTKPFTFRFHDKKIGRSTVYVDCTNFVSEEIENNMGSCIVHFTGTESYTGGGVLNIENNMGSVIVRVPSSWKIRANMENNMGSVSIPETDVQNGPSLTLTGENNMGSLRVEYV